MIAVLGRIGVTEIAVRATREGTSIDASWTTDGQHTLEQQHADDDT